MYQLPKGTEITAEIIKDMIDYNDKRRPRFDKLDNYYIGQQDILKRTKADTIPNTKVMVNHAKYIVDTNTGYLLGNPVSYTAPDDLDITPVTDAYKRQVINNLDTELAKELAIFGVKYEYVYANENAEPRSVALDVRNTLICYDDSLAHNKLFAINYRPIYAKNTDKEPDHYDVLAITDKQIMGYILKGGSLIEKPEDNQEHFFGQVPVIEYANNSEYLGDFEPVISLIDAYNLVQSDRVNDREQLVDAILLFYGMGFDAEQMDSLKEHRAIANIPADGRVEYLTKQLSEADADILRKTIEADIHKISMVPNMADVNFVGNSSGVAIRYKLLSFEQNIKNKERHFEKGLMERFKLYANFLAASSKMPADIPIEDVDAIFLRNLPSNDYETSQMINNLNGLVDKELLVSQLSFVTDADETVAKAEEEGESAQTDTSDYGKNEITDQNKQLGGITVDDNPNDDNVVAGQE